MATILRDWSYQYQWLYDGISRLAALSVGGEGRFRQMALQGLTIAPETRVLDMCCGAGQATQVLVQRSHHVTGLDASPNAIQRAKQRVPQATYVQAFAEKMPFDEAEFDLVHTSTALHEMEPEQLRQILQEVLRVLKPGSYFTFADFHAPNNPIHWIGVSVFLALFETETAWELIRTDLPQLLQEVGFAGVKQRLYAGNSLQVIQAMKPAG
jgi:demethylmenaquinone methyltransferase/2-methoxy-6-polyprenyl-1,4-benzoquinol methylase